MSHESRSSPGFVNSTIEMSRDGDSIGVVGGEYDAPLTPFDKKMVLSVQINVLTCPFAMIGFEKKLHKMNILFRLPFS
jgi:hypothetical protein